MSCKVSHYFSNKKTESAEQNRFFLLPYEPISRSTHLKDLLTLDLKYYEKNSMQI